jgi:hypothetical protein
LHAGEHERIVLSMTAIFEARKRAQVRQIDVAAAIGRNLYWLNCVELGKQAITPEEQAAVLRAIEKLAAFDAAVLRRRQEFLAGLHLDLKLPPPPRANASHRVSLPGE